MLVARWERTFELGDPPNYEPDADQSLAARAKREGTTGAELAYDLMLENGGRTLLYRPFLNYTDFNLDVAREMLLDPYTVPGLGDAGAHVGMISDGSMPTFFVSHYGKDRTRGERLPLEWLVKAHSADTATLVGLNDRGTLEPGKKADVNLIDFERLGIGPPEMVFDLPAGGKRLIQRATGYRATLVSGHVTFEDGEATGELPGKLIRGSQVE